MSEQVRRDAIRLLNALIASSEAEKWENVEAFVAVTTDDESGRIHVDGTWTDPVEAIAWAIQHETDLNKGAPPDEIPFVVNVFPVQKVTPT